LKKLAKILIDPGHGGKDPGAVVKGIREADCNWVWGLSLKEYLKTLYKFQVDLTRWKEEDNPTLEQRGKKAKGYNAFISIHCNAAANPNATGMQIYYRPSPPSISFATLLEKKLKPLWKVNAYPDTILYKSGLGVLRASAVYCPAVLIELGFLTNPSERLLLITTAERLKRCQEIAKAISEIIK